jgi:hypothetical protein
MKKLFLLGFLAIVSIIMAAPGQPVASFAAPFPVNNDLWDISAGTIVTGSSTILNHDGWFVSDSKNMFGGTLPNTVEPGKTIFEDWRYYKGDQWITWQTKAAVTLGSLNLFSSAYNAQRSFSSFKLYADDNLIVDFIPTTSFNGIYTTIFTPVTAQNFRAEFGWVDVTGWTENDIDWARSVRVRELDGFAPGVKNPVPIPATVGLLLSEEQTGPTYTITSSRVDTNGTITPFGAVTVLQGASQSFVIQPNPGWKLEDLRVDWVSQSLGAGNNTYTFTNVQANHTINVHFHPI